MLRRTSPIVRVIVATCLTALPASASAAPPVVGAGEAPNVSSNSVAFTHLVVRIKPKPRGAPEVRSPGASFDADYVRSFNGQLRREGLPVPSDESALFATHRPQEARFQLAGAFFDASCGNANEKADGAIDQECSVGVQWELFDRARGAVVYRVTTRGSGRDAEPNALLLKALHACTIRPKFLEAVRTAAPDASTATEGPAPAFEDEPDPPAAIAYEPVTYWPTAKRVLFTAGLTTGATLGAMGLVAGLAGGDSGSSNPMRTIGLLGAGAGAACALGALLMDDTLDKPVGGGDGIQTVRVLGASSGSTRATTAPGVRWRAGILPTGGVFVSGRF